MSSPRHGSHRAASDRRKAGGSFGVTAACRERGWSLRLLPRRLLLAALAASSVTCSGDTGPSGAQASIAALLGQGQTAPVGAVLPESLVARATNQAGDPVAGVVVNWSVSGGGSVVPAVDTTGVDGRSAAQRTLGTAVGTAITSAAAQGAEGSPVAFADTAVAATSPTVSIVTPPPAAALDQEVWDPSGKPVVSVTDQQGVPLVGVTVTTTLADRHFEFRSGDAARPSGARSRREDRGIHEFTRAQGSRQKARKPAAEPLAGSLLVGKLLPIASPKRRPSE
jgi:hypothetical protein